jgi:hypothetical protein
MERIVPIDDYDIETLELALGLIESFIQMRYATQTSHNDPDD